MMRSKTEPYHIHKIAVTGGIGSGKSTICKIFQSLGIPTFQSDIEAKKIIASNPMLQQRYIELFGAKAYENGKLNGKYIAAILFTHPEKKKAIEEALHPLVHDAFKAWCDKQKCHIVINETALLFETNRQSTMDTIITVTAPESLRIDRVMQRDKITKEEVLARMKNQWPDEEKIKRSDDSIISDNKSSVILQVLKIYQKLAPESLIPPETQAGASTTKEH